MSTTKQLQRDVRRSSTLGLHDELSLPADEAGDGSAPADTGR
jgi:hypothetical protein